MSWNKELAYIWTNMVGPSRPTVSELAIYSKWARIIQEKTDRKLKLLVLGSTPEFRDWGVENDFEITVMDCNLEYYNAVSREIRHKNIKEQLLCKKWQELEADNEFDIIIGDLVIGNIEPEELEGFISKISKALTVNGLFLGKSFYCRREYKPVPPEKIVLDYYNGTPWHPYSAMVYDLSIYCMENNLLSFTKQYNILEKLNEKGIMKDETFEYFKDVGWNTNMKFLFHIPYLDEYEKLIEKYLHIYAVEYGNDVYSKNFPLHIVGCKNNKILPIKGEIDL